MKDYNNLIDSISKTGLTKYTDKDGKIHFTTKSLEQLEEEKEQKLTYEKGPICSMCGKRNKDFRIDIDKNKLCKKCYEKTWKKHFISGDNITINAMCPVCNKKLIIALESEDSCECGAIYSAGFKDEFYYGIDFYERI